MREGVDGLTVSHELARCAMSGHLCSAGIGDDNAGLNLPLLINILGHAAGALIFAFAWSFCIAAAMVRLWGRFYRSCGGLLPAWNLGSLVVLARPFADACFRASGGDEFLRPQPLPAVLLQVSLRAHGRLWWSRLRVSMSAVIMHFWEIQGNGATLHQTALLVITIGFLALAVLPSPRRHQQRPGKIRILASMCLALRHVLCPFWEGPRGRSPAERADRAPRGHSSALFVLLQDYRFVLAGCFVLPGERVVAAVLTALVILGYFNFPDRTHRSHPLKRRWLISICLFLVLFAGCAIGSRQAHPGHLPARQRRRTSGRVKDCPAFSNEGQYIDWAAAPIAAAVNSKDYAVIAQNEQTRRPAYPSSPTCFTSGSSPKCNWAEVVVPVWRGKAMCN